MNNTTQRSKWVFLIPTLLFLIALAYGINHITNGALISPLTGDHHVQIDAPKATVQLNKSFAFPVMNQQGQKAGEFIYTIQAVDLRDEVLIRGQKAEAISGKNFIVLNIQLQNKLNQAVNINARDYVRLSSDNKKTWIAPDIYNDPVEAQPIAVVYTKVGFSVDDSATKNLTLQVGQINGPKQYISFSF